MAGTPLDRAAGADCLLAGRCRADAGRPDRRLLRRQYESPTDRPPAALLLDVDRLRPKRPSKSWPAFCSCRNIELHTLATAAPAAAAAGRQGQVPRATWPGPQHADDRAAAAGQPPRRHSASWPSIFSKRPTPPAGRSWRAFMPPALELLVALPWTGNLDELADAVREACQRATGPRIAPADLPDWVQAGQDAPRSAPRATRSRSSSTSFWARSRSEILARALRQGPRQQVEGRGAAGTQPQPPAAAAGAARPDRAGRRGRAGRLRAAAGAIETD